MSVPVRLEDLTAALADHPWGYLATVGEDGRPHVVAVTPTPEGAVLRVRHPGRRTRANAGSRPMVTLVHPPAAAGGYTLLVDGTAVPDDDGVLITPTSAVLHRPAAPGGEPSATGCAADCRPVDAGSPGR